MKDVPAPGCLRDKVSVRPIAFQGQFAEMGCNGRRQVRVLGPNRDTASCTQQLHICPCQYVRYEVDIRGDITRSFKKCVRPQKQQFSSSRQIAFRTKIGLPTQERTKAL